VPSFRQHRETLRRWERFPALERLDDGVALTFDDGPDPDCTPQVLDALAAAGAQGVFFLVGEQVEAHPELARRVADEGHLVALHGFRHVEHDELGAEARADLERGGAAVAEATGKEPRLYRPPYGRFSEESYAAVRELGLTPVYWSAWGADWEPIPAERIAELTIRDLEPGAIVLLHDSPRYANRPSAAPTAEALPPILAALKERGLETWTPPAHNPQAP
jgi:peptidoglycan/xylan/chitin deacetylase (PgdA/CDA1 family)